jgi:hypothetical protein
MTDEARPVRETGPPPGTTVRDLRLLAFLSHAVALAFTAAVFVANVFRAGEVPRFAGALVLCLLAVLSIARFAFPVMWLYLARTNLDSLADAAPRWSRGWTIGAWFVPLVNLVLLPWVIGEVAWHSLPRRQRGAGLALGVAWPVLFLASFVINGGLPESLEFAGLSWEPNRDAGWWAPTVTASVFVVSACQVALVALVTRAQMRHVAIEGSRDLDSSPVRQLS